MREISYQELQQLSPVTLIDVREVYEYTSGHLESAVNIPMSELGARLGEISKEGDVVLYCRSGSRSSYAIQALESAGWGNLINLRGGLVMAH